MRKGFTLIELLVVISIIGLLSSVVLASLASAARKAQDATVRETMNQFRTLAEYAFQTSGNYTLIQQIPPPGSIPWFLSASDCANGYAALDSISIQAKALCTAIVKAGGTAPPSGSYFFTSFNSPGYGAYDSSKYSFMAWLPGSKKYLCIGSSGMSDSSVEGGTPTGKWDLTGCYNNP